MPKVSVIIPTYNRANMVYQAIESVLAQTFNDFEVMIVDDGSSDETREVVSNIKDPRIKYIYQENAGLAAARNIGIRNTSGEYIAFLDDDDLWDKGKLEPQVALLESNPEIGLATCGWRNIAEDDGFIKENNPWQWAPQLGLMDWLYACPTIVNGVLVRRRWLESAGRFDESLSIFEDWDLWLRLAGAGCQMAWIEQALCTYRIHRSNMVYGTKNMRASMLRILDKFFSQSSLPGEIQEQKNKIYGRAYLRIAGRAAGAGQTDEVKQNLRDAIKIDPGLLDNQSEAIVNFMLDYRHDPLITNDPDQFIQTMINSLPEELGDQQQMCRIIQSHAIREDFYRAYQTDNWREVRKKFWSLVTVNPAALREPGVWSVTLEATIGNQKMQQVRKITKKRFRSKN